MVHFRVWAPYARDSVDVQTGGARHPMRRSGGGWWEVTVADAAPGSDYSFLLDKGAPLPDPRSAWQPDGVHGPSRVVDHSVFGWHDAGWRGVPLLGSVIYELHIGTFTPDGTFDAAIARLDHLVDLGVDLVEVLPVNAFPGRHGWGYDGVDLFAVQDSYGGPDGFKRFVDAAHAKGLGVVLDVVYNHLGPSGNYLSRFGPYFTSAHATLWGPAVNYDDAGSEEVRRFVADNALMWLRDYHVDGLRLDAVHAIVDTSATHILEELADEVAAFAAAAGRQAFLIAESDLNDPRVILSRDAGGLGMDAQWSDDFHHALHAVATGETDGYYADFGALEDLAVALTNGFVYAGRHSGYRGRRHGRPLPLSVPGHRLLGYVQDHDQIGNRAQGERLSQLVSPELVKVAAALVLTSPFTLMIFMGEEWGAGTPWQYFTDHDDPELAAAVRTGRREEFAAFGWRPEDVPDPQDPATFRRSVLDWGELDKEPHAGILDWHKRLLRLRREVPALADGRFDRLGVEFDEDERWLVASRPGVAVAANLAGRRQRVPVDGATGEVLAASAADYALDEAGVELPAESVVVVRTSA